MSEVPESTSGAQPDASGTREGTQSQQSGNESDEPKRKTVSWDDHKRALDDLHRFKREAKEYQDKLNSMEAKSLAEKEDFKTLAERYQKEAEQLRTERDDRDKAYVYEKKYSQVLSKAQSAGLRNPSDLELIGLDDIKHEITSEGRVLVSGVDEFVDHLKKTRPHWFQDGEIPTFNGGGASKKKTESEELTVGQFVELERKYKREGKTSELKDLYRRFEKQRGLSAR